MAEEIVETVQNPPVVDNPPFEVLPGLMVLDDIEQYNVLEPEPTMINYRELSVYGMGPPSSGGITVGETLNILEEFEIDQMVDTQFWYHFLESTAIAFADRNAYIGDNRPGYEYVPITGLLSQGFASERAQLIDPLSAQPKPVAPGNPCPYDDSSDCSPAASALASPGTSTTHLVTSDRWGNIVSYTLTIEATGGSGIVVPGRGYLLNNELTDFDLGRNAPAPGKRPRSSMSPTIVMNEDGPFLAVGTPGGSTIITTVAEVLLNRIDRGMSLPEAIAAPRANQRNRTTVS